MSNFKIMFYVGLCMIMFQACSDKETTENPEGDKAQLNISFTDAPIDNAEVSACVVTVSKIYLDGVEVEGFSSTTVDLLAYQNGDTYAVGEFEIDAKSYNSIDLELTPDSPDENVHPHGCYILDAEGEAHALLESKLLVSLDSKVEATANSSTDVLLDFDLRKCVKEEDSADDQYDFVSNANLSSAIRVTTKENKHIKGECSSLFEYSDEIVVYVYAKGEFNEATETTADSETKLQFTNAISSAKLNGDKEFQLSYLQEGDYELHFYGYDRDAEGQLNVKGKLQVESQLAVLDLTKIGITAESDVNLNLLITGIQ